MCLPISSELVAAGGRGIEDVHLSPGAHDQKVVDERPVRVRSLARELRLQLARCHPPVTAGTEPGQALRKSFMGQRSPYLGHAVPEMLARQAPEPGIAATSAMSRGADAAPRIALAGGCEHRVRAGVDAAVDHPREVHAEEGELRIRHRVDEARNEVAPVFGQFVVLASGTARSERVGSGRPSWLPDRRTGRRS